MASFDEDLTNIHATTIDHEGGDHSGRTNVSRAEDAVEGLKAYWGTQGYDEPVAVISDFLSDLMHLCRMNGIDLNDCLRRAAMNFDIETEGGE